VTASRRTPPGGWQAHEGLIASVAARYYRALGGQGSTPGAVEWDDLMQAGRMGIVRAAEKWDPERGSWTTYALPWIRHKISRYCFDHSRLVRLPVQRQTKLLKAKVLKPERHTRLALDAPLGGEGRPFHTVVADPNTTDPVESIAAEADAAAVHAAVEQLPERLRAVVRGRFYAERTLQQIGDSVGLSRERIRQIEEEALVHLRRALRSRRRAA
jgi:RNA polymerase sigma factor (sigma-70 family)